MTEHLRPEVAVVVALAPELRCPLCRGAAVLSYYHSLGGHIHAATTTNSIPCTRCGGKGFLCPDDPPHAVAPPKETGP